MKKVISLIVLILVIMAGVAWAEKAVDKRTKEMVRELFSKGHLALAFGNYDEAIRCYKKTLELDPNLSDAHRFMGDIYVKKGVLDKALSEYKKAIAIKPNSAATHVGLGDVYLKKGLLDDSLLEYKKAIAIYPDYAPAHAGLGDVYLRREKIDKALSEYNKAISADSEHASAHFNLGCIYYKQGLTSLAANHLYSAGSLYFKQGNREGALKAYENLKRTNSKKLELLLFEKIYPELKKKKSESSK